MSTQLRLAPYPEQQAGWPTEGRHILAQHDAETIVVYHAYQPESADWAVEHQRFGGPWSFDRMSWIKPDFLWLMYRSDWARKPGQERVLAVTLKRAGFEAILASMVESRYHPEIHGPDRAAWRQRGKAAQVRMQWDPDHTPTGEKTRRRAIQLGLRREASRRYATEWTLRIDDVTAFVHTQREHAQPSRTAMLQLPEERLYQPRDPEVWRRLRLS